MDDFRREHLSRLDQLELRLDDLNDTLSNLEIRLDALENGQADSTYAMNNLKSQEKTDYNSLKEEQTLLQNEIEAIRQDLEEIQLENSGN